MSSSWSERVAVHFSLRLPADVEAWLNDRLWAAPGGAEFCQPLSPEQLLRPEPGLIWPGFMTPDVIPLVGNGYGDWLCLRIDARGEVVEVIQWSHDGGDWIPYGRTLAEALLYDAAAAVLYERKPHFIEPEPPPEQVFRYAEWARDWIPNGERLNLQPAEHARPDLLASLLEAGVAKIACRRDLCLKALDTPLKRRSSAATAQQIGVDWSRTYIRWLFDTETIPVERRVGLAGDLGLDAATFAEQDWPGAERQALAVAGRRGDLGWPLDVLGWASERRGDWQTAIEWYWRGLEAPVFTDQAVAFRTQWFPESFGKFPAFRLAEYRERLSPEKRNHTYLQLLWKGDGDTLRRRVCEFWLRQACGAERSGDHLHAYRFFYNAGWDCGSYHLEDFSEIYRGLLRCAKAMGATGLAQIAQLHLNSL